MRVLICFCLLVLTGTATSAQTNYRSLGVYSSFFNNTQMFSGFSQVTGGGSIENKSTFLLGAEYTKGLNSWLKISGAIEFSERAIERRQDYGPTGMRQPVVVTSGKIQLVSLPINLRLDFLKYFFITSGATIDFNLRSDLIAKQGGIGATGGLGVKYDFKKMTVFINPYYQMRSIISFNGTTSHLLTDGFRTGLNYRF